MIEMAGETPNPVSAILWKLYSLYWLKKRSMPVSDLLRTLTSRDLREER
jgi:hypothetical protein